ncbi:class II fructose-bisphosphate aldolase [Saccharopolyspora sp. NPDC002686]|uniref:class II fructose-bisphosphate aldolase n=1 Tax=Saccharopolyspora sp. NPDC002686 TaxID=3154541 RepID=UPI00331CB8A2
MPRTPTAELISTAAANRTGIAAFNVITLEHVEAVVAGAESTRSPVIVQISQNAIRFHRGRLAPLAAACRAIAEDSTAQVALHLDHIEDVELLHQTAEVGFDSVMFDASKLSYSDNLAATRAAAEWAHQHGLWLEAELGEVGGKEGAHAPGVRTDPTEAREFVAATGVDALAVAVGSSHAMTTQTARLDHALIAELEASAGVPLVLHGSSGVPHPELARAVENGMTKINIGTALNVAFTTEVRHALLANDAVVDPRTYLKRARDGIALAVAEVHHALSRTGAGRRTTAEHA